MSDGDSRLWDIYIAWSGMFCQSTYVLPRVVTDWVVGDRDIRDIDVPILLCAARMWERCASAYDRERRAERKVRHTIMVGRAA